MQIQKFWVGWMDDCKHIGDDLIIKQAGTNVGLDCESGVGSLGSTQTNIWGFFIKKKSNIMHKKRVEEKRKNRKDKNKKVGRSENLNCQVKGL